MKRFPFYSVLPLVLLLSACAPRMSSPAQETGERSATETPIVAALDLVNVSDDRLRVELDPGMFSLEEVVFRLPRVIPGSYKEYEFGQYIEGFDAYGYDGERLAVEQPDNSTWRIADATRLDRIVYFVNDTYDLERGGDGGFGGTLPFSPSGTNIDPDIFVLNLHGFIGYFEGLTDLDYTIHVTAPIGMEKATALPLAASDTDAAVQTVTDTYHAARYFDVVDNPMLYGQLDVETFRVDDIDIDLALYSPNGTHSASEMAEVIKEMMAAQREYLSNLKTTNHYSIFVYLFEDADDEPTGTGALEHHTSTVVVLPESLPAPNLANIMVDVVSHEFFHIVSPLNVHSEDIHNFDHYAPTFSKHLWMYEGVTEYFASHFQVYEGLESREAFYGKLAGKMDFAASFDDTMSFTEMSERVIEEPYASSYLNVYNKGALIGMCLDLIMRENSGGERSLLSLMEELSETYGPDRPFEDDGIIQEITERTYPAVGAFLNTHVVGTTPIDYDDCLGNAGIAVVQNEVPSGLLMLNPRVPFVGFDGGTGKMVFRDMELNSTLQAMGARPGDVIESINGTAYTQSNIGALIQAAHQWTPDTSIEMIVVRDGDEVELSGLHGTPTAKQLAIEEVSDPTAEQLALRDAWLGHESSLSTN